MAGLPPKDWDPQDALANLTMEAAVFEEDNAKTVARLISEASPLAASRLVQIALYSTDERRSLEASKYLVDRVLGPVASPNGSGEETNPLEAALGAFVVEVEEHVAAAAASSEGDEA
jgi:hypothetical protein